MSKYNDLLVDFMRQKSVIVKMFSGIPLASEADLAELSIWSEGICRDVLARLDSDRDESCCPWCLIFYNCDGCSYGGRNGTCADRNSNSLYTQIQELIMDRYTGLVSIPGMRDLIATTKQKFAEIVDNDAERGDSNG